MKQANTVIRSDLHARGLKATPQRLAVLQAIAGTSGYFTPQGLYENLKGQRDGVSLVTVYRALEALTEVGLVCQIESTGNAHIYARCSSTHHHHLVCEECARVVEFNGCELENLAGKLARETGFEIYSHSLEFTGLCRECSIKTEQPGTGTR